MHVSSLVVNFKGGILLFASNMPVGNTPPLMRGTLLLASRGHSLFRAIGTLL